MMLVPSLSIINGKVARLTQGDFSKEKFYDESPIDVARQFEDHGVRRLHLIDLDRAKGGNTINYEILEVIASYTQLKVNFAGGIQTDGDVQKAFEYGAESITSATLAILNKTLFANWIMSYGREKIALAADSLNGKVQIHGWQKETTTELFDHIAYFYERGLKYLKASDIAMDGVLEGPSFDLYKSLLRLFPDLSIYASGGVRNMEDIKKLSDIGVYGAIFGKAYYEGNITLKEIEHHQAIQS